MNAFVIFIQRLKINDATISDLLFSVKNGKTKTQTEKLIIDIQMKFS